MNVCEQTCQAMSLQDKMEDPWTKKNETIAIASQTRSTTETARRSIILFSVRKKANICDSVSVFII